MPPAGFKPAIPASKRPQTHALGYSYTGARKDATQQSGQTPDKEEDTKNITVYVSGYTETNTTGKLSPPTVWRRQSEFVSSRQSGQIPAAVRIGFECRCGVAISMDTHAALNVTTRICGVYRDKCRFAVLCRF